MMVIATMSEVRETMLGMPPHDALWWANEIRIWALAGAAFLGFVTFTASYAQIRLQATVSAIAADQFKRYQIAAQERISEASKAAAAANERSSLLEKEAANAKLETEKL